MDVQAAAPPQVVSSTRQCVCGGWTRYVVCQYCGTTDPHVSAAGMVSSTPLVQLTPEQAVMHSAALTQAGPSLPGWGHDGESAPPAFASVSAALPPTTFAEAQFGAAPSAAAVFASTADSAQLPAAYAEPIPGWSEQPVAAPSGWSTTPAAAPVEPQRYDDSQAFQKQTYPGQTYDAPAFEPGPEQHESARYEPLPSEPAQYEPVPSEPAQYEPAQYEPAQYDEDPGYPVSALTASGAAAPWPDPVIPGAVAAEPKDESQEAKRARRPLTRWAVFAAAGVVVAAAGGAYLYTQSGSSSGASAPVAVHRTLTVAAAAPAGWTAAGPATTLTGSAIASTDKLHRAAELTAAGVTSATVQTFLGPGSLKVTALTERAATPAQAATLASETRQAGLVPPSVVRGITVITLRAPSDAAGYAKVLPGWAARLRA